MYLYQMYVMNIIDGRRNFLKKKKRGHVSRLEKKIAVLEDKLSQKNEQKNKNIFCGYV